MIDQAKALTTAIENSTKVANSPFFSIVIDKMLGFKISEWEAQGEIIKKQMLDNYEDAKSKGLGFQYISAFRSNTNLINTGRKATSYIDRKSHSNIGIDNDVFWGLLEHSKEISNEEMQELIAKIIAGEYNVPGTYSMSTLQTIKMLGKKELKLFESVCALIVNEYQIPEELFLLSSVGVKEIMKEIGVDFGSLSTLQSLGLFLPNGMTQISQNMQKGKIIIKYFDKFILYVPVNKEQSEIKLPSFYSLSDVGKQIIKHLNPKYNEKYFNWLTVNYKIPDYTIAK